MLMGVCTQYRMKLKKIDIEELENLNFGLKIFRKINFDDSRGSLQLDFEGGLGEYSFSHLTWKTSCSKKNIGRGLHLQNSKKPLSKIITVNSGSIVDFLYNPKHSPSLVYCFEYSKADKYSILIPPDIAHGFITLSDTIFSYITLGKYSEKDEITFNLLSDAARVLDLNSVKLSAKDKSFTPINFD